MDDALPSAPATSAHAGTVAVVGSLNVDLAAEVRRHPLPGETVIATGSTRSPGGKGANQALAASRAGARTLMIGAVGEDEDAEVATSLLAEDGVDLSSLARVTAPTGLAIVTVSADGENAIVVVSGANARVDAAAVERARAALAQAAVVVLQGEIPREGIEHAARIAVEQGARAVLNPAPVLELDRDVLTAARPLVVNEHEARAVLAQLEPAADQEDDGAVARALHAEGVAEVVLTRGGKGSLLVTADGTLQEIPAQQVRAVDTTGAGDGFIGALAARLADGATLEDAARRATEFAALSVQRPGAQASYPSRAELAASPARR